MSDFTKLFKKLDALQNYVEKQLPTIIGVEGLNHFKQSFVNQGFEDERIEKWDEVKRRDANSDWHGFSYGSRANRPGRQRRRRDSQTNYSPAATRRPILSGETQNLMGSLKWQQVSGGVLFTAGTKYAKIHNEGGKMKVFGKHSATMPKRQFMGDSKVLRDRLGRMVSSDIKRILNS
jgi:phage gpG-like protein